MASKLQLWNLRRHSSAILRQFSTSAGTMAPSISETQAGVVTMKGVKFYCKPMYIDIQATSPTDPRNYDAMQRHNIDCFENPHSRTHMFGWESDEAVEKARGQVADLIGASAKEIIFTSGATESNNIAFSGVMHFYREKKKHVITVQTEHKCVLDCCRHLSREGFEITYLPVKLMSDYLHDL